MAVALATSADYLQRTTGLLSPASDSTVMFWAKLNPVPANSTNYILMDAPGTYTDYMAVYAGTTNIDFEGGASHDVTTTAPTDDLWYHIAWVQAGTTQRCYVNGVLVGSFTYDRSAFTVADEFLGSDTFDTAGGKAFAYFRSWSTALTITQIKTELVSSVVVLTTNLWMNTPLTSNLLDLSGNGRNWTGVGSQTFVDGPTLIPNVDASTATSLAPLPYSGAALKMSPTGFSINPDVWYTYTPSDGEIVIGTWAFTSLASANKPRVRVYTGSPGSLTPLVVDLNTSATNVPYTVPLTPGTTYYFDVVNAGVDVASGTTAALTFSAEAMPSENIPTNSMYVNDETFGFPVAILDPSTGTVLNYHTFASGESADILASGAVLAESIDVNGSLLGLARYSPTLALVETITTPVVLSGEVDHIWAAWSGQWYVSGGGALVVIAADGTEGDSWTPTVTCTNTVGFAVSPADTIAYYACTGTAGKAVQAWDLVNDTALADFAAGVAGYNVIQDILCLADGTLLVGYKKTTATRNSYVVHYDTDGSTLATYTIGSATLALNRMARDPSGTSFWAWMYPQSSGGVIDGTNRYLNVRVSDGVILHDFTVTQYERGVYSASASATPTARFGPSFSCTFWLSTVVEMGPPLIPPDNPEGGFTPVIAPSPTGTPVTYPIRWLRRLPHLSVSQVRQFFTMAQLDAEVGVGLLNEPEPIVFLRWSDDGGHSWSSPEPLSMGPLGDYKRRVIWWQLGEARDRVFEISGSDPTVVALINLYLDAKPGVH